MTKTRLTDDDLLYLLVRWRPRMKYLLLLLLALLAYLNVPGRPDL